MRTIKRKLDIFFKKQQQKRKYARKKEIVKEISFKRKKKEIKIEGKLTGYIQWYPGVAHKLHI